MSDEPTDDESTAYNPLYLQGIEYFNECDFFEAHETWEELWTEYRGEARKFYQGLIQAAVALHHFGNGNVRGAKKVYLTSCGYLQEYPAVYEGLDLDTFLAKYARCFEEILQSEEVLTPGYLERAEGSLERAEGSSEKAEIDPELIPEIHLENLQAEI